MKSYIITIIGATILSSLGVMLTPDNMRKYVSVITGFIIISCIVSPLASLTKIDIFSGFDVSLSDTDNYENIYSNAVGEALCERIIGDIKNRLKEEFNCDAQVNAELDAEDGDIKIIKRITVDCGSLDEKAVKRLMEVYNVSEVILNGQKFINKNTKKQE